MAGIEILAVILIIAFILLYVLLLYAAIRVGIGKRDTLGWIATGVAAIIGVLLISYLIGNINNIVPAEWAQILILLGLVTVTGMYALSTRKQADASMKMAEAMTRPYLLLRLDLADDEFFQWDTYEGKSPSDEFNVLIRNAGSGAAKNLYASLWSRKDVYPYTSRGSLAPNEEWKASISKLNVGIDDKIWLPKLREFIKYEDPVIAVTYQDIYNHTWVSYLCLERQVDIDAFVMDGEQNTVELKADDS